MIQEKQFEKQADGAVWLNEEGRRLFLEAWQKKKAEVIPNIIKPKKNSHYQRCGFFFILKNINNM